LKDVIVPPNGLINPNKTANKEPETDAVMIFLEIMWVSVHIFEFGNSMLQLPSHL
jgi:hypothetical protein